MTLYESTRDLHHACEMHPLGQAMVNATITPQQWADWLEALRTIHTALDPHLPPYAQVAGELTLDLVDMLPVTPNPSIKAQDFATTLTTPERIGGAAYVLVGAHRRGGRVTEKRFREAGLGLPTRHVRFFSGDHAEALIQWLRSKEQLLRASQATFIALIDVMEEILPTIPEAKA